MALYHVKPLKADGCVSHIQTVTFARLLHRKYGYCAVKVSRMSESKAVKEEMYQEKARVTSAEKDQKQLVITGGRQAKNKDNQVECA